MSGEINAVDDDGPGRGAGPSPPPTTAGELKDRLKFLELGPHEADVLRTLLSRFQKFDRQFVEEFYDHLRSFPTTARHLDDPQRFERLKQLQRQHLRTLLEADWNDEYAAARRRVGDAHAEVGIEPQFFIGAYFQYVQHCVRHYFEDELTERDRQMCETVMTLLKAVFLDIGLTLDAYFAQSTQKLQNALDLLWRANQDLRQFAHLTSHDLKTPLATVANLCEETLDEFGEQIPEEARTLIENARRRVFRMSDMIDELLSSAVVAESTENREPVEVQRAVADAVDRVRPMIMQKNIRLTLPTTWPKVWGNHVRLRETFYNLLSNAAKYAPERHGTIDVVVRTSGGIVRTEVVDNGPGIPKDELSRVFAPFHRLSTHRHQPGTGLGLYFAKNLVETMGGRIGVESQPGVGSRFFVELPTA